MIARRPLRRLVRTAVAPVAWHLRLESGKGLKQADNMKKVEMHGRKIPFLYQTREEFLHDLYEHRRLCREEMDRMLGRIPGGPLDRYRAGRNIPGMPVAPGDQRPSS